MTEEKRHAGPGMIRTVVVLLLFTAAVAFLLGLVNQVTADPITQYKAMKTQAAMRAVLPASEYSEVLFHTDDPMVEKVYRAGDAGWIIEVIPIGFGGSINMLVGVDTRGAVTGVSMISMSETSGLGANAARESFRSQFVGKEGHVDLRQHGGDIDALTGATVTSTAVTGGVNSALKVAGALMKEGGQ